MLVAAEGAVVRRKESSMRRRVAQFAGVVVFVSAALTISAEPAFSAMSVVATGPVHTIPGLGEPIGVACPPGLPVAKATCYVLDSQTTEFLVPVVHGRPTASTIALHGGIAISCPSATTCAVAEVSHTQGELAWVVNGAVTKTEPVVGSSYLYGVACETAATCVVVGERYGPSSTSVAVVADVSASKSTASAQVVGGLAALDSVDCPSSTACVAVGTTKVGTSGVGAVVSVLAGKASAPRLVAGTDGLNKVSCGSATSCWARGTEFSESKGITVGLVDITSGVPGAKVAGPENAGDIACYSAGGCLFGSATSTYGTGQVISLVAGKTAQVLTLPGFKYGALSGIACPTAVSCLVTGATTFHVPGKWYGGVSALKI
jgi:hypothetical protein